MRVIVTIPAYNEEKTIGYAISGIRSALNDGSYDYSILVVDDGSKDKTRQIAKKAGAEVISHPINYGLAETFKTELRECIKRNADIIVHFDADCQYVPHEIPKLLKDIESGSDLVLGSRFSGKIEYMPIIKRWGNQAFSKVISSICRVKITDGQTGFRAFKRNVAEKIQIISTHTYTQEQIIKAVRCKFKVTEVPVTFRKRCGSKSRLMTGPFDYAVKAWINILRIYRDYEPVKFFGFISSFFIGVGTLIGLWFIYLHFTEGIEGHTGMTMLMLLSIMTGLQIFTFGFLADMLKR